MPPLADHTLSMTRRSNTFSVSRLTTGMSHHAALRPHMGRTVANVDAFATTVVAVGGGGGELIDMFLWYYFFLLLVAACVCVDGQSNGRTGRRDAPTKEMMKQIR